MSSSYLEFFAAGHESLELRFCRHRSYSALASATVVIVASSRSRCAHSLRRRIPAAPSSPSTEPLRRQSSPPTTIQPRPLASSVSIKISNLPSSFCAPPFVSVPEIRACGWLPCVAAGGKRARAPESFSKFSLSLRPGHDIIIVLVSYGKITRFCSVLWLYHVFSVSVGKCGQWAVSCSQLSL